LGALTTGGDEGWPTFTLAGNGCEEMHPAKIRDRATSENIR